METIDNGSLWLRQSLSIGTGTSTKVKIGVLDNDQVFNANDNFIVKKDGTAKMTGNLKITGSAYDLWITNDSTQNIGAAAGMFVYPKGKTSGSTGWFSINCDSAGANYIEITSWGTDPTQNNKDGWIRLLSSDRISINAEGLLHLSSDSLRLTFYKSIGIQNLDTDLTITDVSPTFSGLWYILPGIETNSISAKSITLDPLPNDNNWASYNLNSLGNLVKFGINGEGKAVIESWIGGNQARLELYFNEDGGATLLLKSKKKGELEREHPIGST